ncbi:MAG: hypothetical protein F6J96_35180 [Symploca sp. SIO1C2]|nr:hypothetical protein [Symploca sp. SIO1C2]
MSKKGFFFIFLYLSLAIIVIWLMFHLHGKSTEAAIAIFLAVFVPLGGFISKPITTQLEIFAYNLFVNNLIYRILIFGRPGSGKTTFIRTGFTICNPEKSIRSTENFNCHEFKVNLNLNKKSVDVAIADYKGQDPYEIVMNPPVYFFGDENNRLINSIFFIVDLVPRICDDNGEPLKDKFLLDWLKKDNINEKIKVRISEHYDYINEFSLQLIFKNFYSSNLKNVFLIINKLDLVEKLLNDGYLTLSDFRSAEEFAMCKFSRMIGQIESVCSKLNIDDFSVYTISATKKDNLRPLIAKVLSNEL